MSPSRLRTFLHNTSKTIFTASIIGLSAQSFAASEVQANADESISDEIVVTAFRLPTDLDKTGTSIWVLDKEEIKKRGYLYLTDALASVPGLTINQNGPFGGVASARIRGASTSQTLVLLDGVVITDTNAPSGGFDFGTLELADIERIEVLKGPQSTLWGSDAIGGVINIVSNQASQDLRAEIGSTIGSFGSQQYRGSVSAGNEVGDFHVSYNDTSSDGISKADEDDGNTEDDGYEAQTLALKFSINLPADAKLQLSHRDTSSQIEYDSFGVATGVQDGDERTEVDRTATQVVLTAPAFDGRLQNRLVYGRSDIERANFTNGIAGFASAGERKVLQYQGTLQIANNQQFSFGYEDENSETGGDESDIRGFYGLYQISPIETVTVSMGLRRDDHSKFGSETVGRVSAAWTATESFNINASWGQGFKAPTIFQTIFFCCGATAANPNLVAETSDAFDLGFDWRFNESGSFALTYFTQKTEDQIDFSFAIGGYENIAQVDSDGVELSLNYDFSETVSANLNMAHINSEDGSGNELLRVPELTGDLTVNWQATETLRTTLAMVYNDEELDFLGTVPAWSRFDLTGTWHPDTNIEIFARLENLTDKNYQQVFGYGTPGRSGSVGINFVF